MSRKYRSYGAVLALAATLVFSTAVLAADKVLKDPNAQDMINALSPKDSGKLLTRGLAPSGAGMASAPAQQPSASLDIKFGFNSAQLTAEATKTLDELGKALKSENLAKSHFAIVGHTDAKGSAAYNQKLSEKRAQAVKEFLTSKFGIEPGRLEAQGKGQSALLDPSNPTAEANRRVEIINRGS